MAQFMTPLGPIEVDSTFGKSGAGVAVTDLCAAYRSAKAAGLSAAVVESLRVKCLASQLGTSARAGAALASPSAPAVAATAPVGYPEPKPAGLSPAVIAAGVVGVGLAALLAYKLTR